MNSVRTTKCGCVIKTRSGHVTTCEQPKAHGENECYYHAKCMKGLTSPSKTGDVNDGGGLYSRDDEVESILSTNGTLKLY